MVAATRAAVAVDTLTSLVAWEGPVVALVMFRQSGQELNQYYRYPLVAHMQQPALMGQTAKSSLSLMALQPCL